MADFTLESLHLERFFFKSQCLEFNRYELHAATINSEQERTTEYRVKFNNLTNSKWCLFRKNFYPPVHSSYIFNYLMRGHPLSYGPYCYINPFEIKTQHQARAIYCMIVNIRNAIITQS